MVGVFVNDEFILIDYVLKNRDRVRIVIDDLSFCPVENFIDKVQTCFAKRKIGDFNKK